MAGCFSHEIPGVFWGGGDLGFGFSRVCKCLLSSI